jgi:hypothetical protein
MLDLHGISQDAFNKVIGYEVTGQRAYEARYQRLTRPKEQSGATGGIGYDFGQATKAQVKEDWGDKVDARTLKALLSCCGVSGIAARDLVAKLHGTARSASLGTTRSTCSRTTTCRATPRCAARICRAMTAHCKGVLFSLVLNRGPSFDEPKPRYAEMRDIKAAIKSGRLERVPAALRSMKRLWPDSRGLRDRRDDEARLWELGLELHHPEAHASLDQVAPIADPDVVARVQEQLKNLGYWQVGSADGSLTPQGKTEAAILAFRNHEGLPLRPSIDDELLNALQKARPAEVADGRANATVHDLRAQGSQTIAFTDKVKAWGGRLFGGAGFGTTGLLALVTENATALSSAKEAIGGLGLSPQMMLIAAAFMAGLVVLAAMGSASGTSPIASKLGSLKTIARASTHECRSRHRGPHRRPVRLQSVGLRSRRDRGRPPGGRLRRILGLPRACRLQPGPRINARPPAPARRMRGWLLRSPKKNASSRSPIRCSSAMPSARSRRKISFDKTRRPSMPRRLTPPSALLAICLAGCATSSNAPAPVVEAPVIPAVPADVLAWPVTSPDRELDAGEVEKLWKTDRAALARVNACLHRLVCQYQEVRQEIGKTEIGKVEVAACEQKAAPAPGVSIAARKRPDA